MRHAVIRTGRVGSGTASLKAVVLAVTVLAAIGSAVSPRLVPTTEEHLVWLPDASSELGSILSAERTGGGALVAQVTTEQLRVLTERRIPFMVISRDQFRALQGEQPVAKSESPLRQLPIHQKVAIIADDSAYQMCQSQLLTYQQDVEARFDAELTIYHGTWPTAESLRQFIKALWTANQITGVIQVGYLPYAMWKFPWGEVCPLPLFHEDMDATFLDRDGDGKYDWHTWGPNDGPELWCAYMRPASGRLDDLPGFLDKCHSYYQGQMPVPRRAEVCICRDWGSCVSVIRDALQPIYGDSIDTTGGPGIAVAGQSYLDLLGKGYELTNVWVHSAPYYHQFDTVPHQDVQDYEVRGQTPGSLLTVMWACHGMDWDESPSHCFAESYVFNSGYGLADIGVTRSLGTPQTEWLFGLLADSSELATAYYRYIDSLYNPDWIHAQWPSDTTECFMFDFALFGNPFWPSGPVGVSESGSERFKQDAVELRPSIFARRVMIEVRCTTADAPAVAVYDRQGRFVRRLACGGAESGLRTYCWDGTDNNRRVAPRGVYFVRLHAGDFRDTRKMVKTD